MAMKLYYFPLYARGEAIRMTLAHSNTSYVEENPSGPLFGAGWAALKPKMPSGQMPVLELENGMKLHQSQPILRYLGKVHGYYPTDALDAFKIDAILEDFAEAQIGFPFMEMFGKPVGVDQLKEMEMSQEKVFVLLTKILNQNKGSKFLAGDKLSIADFQAFSWATSYALNLNGDPKQKHVYEALNALLQNYPTVVAWTDCMQAELSDYMSSRPQERTI